MNEFLKQNWFKIGVLLILIFTVIGVFYLFKIRPMQMKKECIKKYPFAFGGGEGFGSVLGGSDESNYKKCLAENGL